MHSAKSEEFKRLLKELNQSYGRLTVDFILIPGLATIIYGKNRRMGVMFLLAWAATLVMILGGLFFGGILTIASGSYSGVFIGVSILVAGVIANLVLRFWLLFINWKEQRKAVRAFNAYFEKMPFEERLGYRKNEFKAVAILSTVIIPVSLFFYFTTGVPVIVLYFDVAMVFYAVMTFVKLRKLKNRNL